MKLETERLLLREMTENDLDDLKEILMDGPTMYAYEGAFTEEETRRWLEGQFRRYRENGFGLWAVVLKETGEMIGQCGLSWQDADLGEPVLEVGYLFKRKHWRHGYAAEAARACRDYAFNVLHAPRVYSIIRDTNTASQNVAKRNGMTLTSRFTKHYRGVDMPCPIWSIPRKIPIRPTKHKR